jgi:DNA-binding transcriptional LysR family regulator
LLRLTEDLVLLAQLVEAGSFTAASRLTGITKSRLSRRLLELEEALGVRLIERTSRSFHATELALKLVQYGAQIRGQGDAALSLVQSALGEPSGTLCVACPVVLAELMVGQVAASFGRRYPKVQVTFDVTTGLPNVEADHYDLFFRASPSGLPDSERIARQLLLTPYELVASPEWLAAAGSPREPADLQGLEGIGWWQIGATPRWRLHNNSGEQLDIAIRPRFQTNNLAVARMAAIAGVGMARLPRPICSADLLSGRLVRVLSNYAPESMGIYVVYPTRKSLTPAGRLFLEEVEAALGQFMKDNLVLGPAWSSLGNGILESLTEDPAEAGSVD